MSKRVPDHIIEETSELIDLAYDSLKISRRERESMKSGIADYIDHSTHRHPEKPPEKPKRKRLSNLQKAFLHSEIFRTKF